jgi:HAMP domain-containing protein
VTIQDQSAQGAARRRSTRYPLFAPIQVAWTNSENSSQKAEAHAKDVSIHGGLLQFLNTASYPRTGAELVLRNLLSGEEIRARAGAIRRAKDGALLGIAVELLRPNETFWGLTFWVKKTTIELKRLDQEITAGNVDPRVLREFRDAVDYVRKTAWAVQEWQERQRQHRDTATVLPLLFTERVRRAAQLCEAVNSGLAEHEIKAETEGIEALFRAARRLYANLKELFGEKELR